MCNSELYKIHGRKATSSSLTKHYAISVAGWQIQVPLPKVLVIFPRPVKEILVRWPRCEWRDNIKIHLTDIVWESSNWIYSSHDKNKQWSIMKRTMKFWVPHRKGGKIKECSPGNFISRKRAIFCGISFFFHVHFQGISSQNSKHVSYFLSKPVSLLDR
jgi:hypothetical protein